MPITVPNGRFGGSRENGLPPCRSRQAPFDVLIGSEIPAPTFRSRTDYRDGDTTMRVMVIVKATPESETGDMSGEWVQPMMEAMGAYNEELVKAGIMLQGDGL